MNEVNQLFASIGLRLRNLERKIRFSPSIPPTPTNLATSNLQATTLTIVWSIDDRFSIDEYGILRNGVIIGYSSTPEYTDATVSTGTQYNYNVIAFGLEGNSSGLSRRLLVTTP